MQECFETQKPEDAKKDNRCFSLFKKAKGILQRCNPAIILGIAALHYIATALSVAVSFVIGMAHFDSGANLSLGEKVLSTLADILVFPLVRALPSSLPEPILFAILLLNSLLWGCFLYLLAKSISSFLSKLLGRRD